MTYFHTAIICSQIWGTVDGGGATVFSAAWLVFAIFVWANEKYFNRAKT